jgi:hypothetical protein
MKVKQAWNGLYPVAGDNIRRFSSYRALNTLRLGYKNQSVNAA